MAVAATPTSTLVQIRDKVRKITARPDVSQLSEEELDHAIQTFYFYDLPQTLQLFNLQETYTFSTEKGIEAYAFNRNKYMTVFPPLFIDGYRGFWSQNREQFYRAWSKLEFKTTAGAAVLPLTFQVPNRPILRAQARYDTSIDSSILISVEDATGATTALIDDGNGNLIDSTYLNQPSTGAATNGTVDYETGTFVINSFTVAPPATNLITISSVPYVAGRPTSCLFFDDTFILRPVPDKAYKVSIETYRNPLEFLLTSDNPKLNEWWQVIAMGASLKIFEDGGEMEEYAKFYPLYEKYKVLAQRRTIVQQTNQRTSSIYADHVSPNDYQNNFNRF